MQRKNAVISRILLVLLLLGFLWFGYSFIIVGSQYWNFLHTVKASDIERIEFYSLDDNNHIGPLIVSIQDYETIKSISDTFPKAVSYLPNHPSYTPKVYSIFHLKTGKKFEFILAKMAGSDDSVYLLFARIRGSTTSYYGNAKINNPNFSGLPELLAVFH